MSKREISLKEFKEKYKKKVCDICNKDIIIDYINQCELGLTIFIYIRCLHCGMHYIIVKPCDTKEELNKLLLMITDGNIIKKEFVKSIM